MQRRIRFSYTKEYYIRKKENYVCPKITLQDIAYNDKSKVKPAIGVEGTQVMDQASDTQVSKDQGLGLLGALPLSVPKPHPSTSQKALQGPSMGTTWAEATLYEGETQLNSVLSL